MKFYAVCFHVPSLVFSETTVRKVRSKYGTQNRHTFLAFGDVYANSRREYTYFQKISFKRGHATPIAIDIVFPSFKKSISIHATIVLLFLSDLYYSALWDICQKF